jgi:hypothetical protein
MRKILRIALLFMSLLICAGVRAQNQGTVIKGTVTDEKGVTLPGATVTVKGAKINAITDIDGKYSIQVPAAGKTLVFSFIGMESQEVLIGNRATINVKLLLTSNALADVVVIGYGTQ